MIRVLHCVKCLGMGGIQSFIMNLYYGIDHSQIQFDFLVNELYGTEYEREVSQNGEIFVIAPRNKGFFKYQSNLNDFFKKNQGRYDAVHLHLSSLSSIEPLIYARKFNVPRRIIHSHNSNVNLSIPHRLLHNANKLRLPYYATDYFACGELAGKWLFKGVPLDKGRISLIPNGINCDKFSFSQSVRDEYRRSLHLEGKNVLIHIGRFNAVKNHSFLVDVFKSYCQREPDSTLLLVGDGVLKEEIEKKAIREGLEGKVLFPGNRSDVAQLLQASDVFLLPSFHEGFPVVMLEAQSTGLPCLYSNTISKEVELTDDVTALPIDQGTDCWQEKIADMTSKKIDRRQRNTILRNSIFNISKVCETITEFYTSDRS